MKCSVDTCCRDAKSRGWCQTHYYRWRSTGSPTGLRKAENGEPLRWLREHAKFDGDECLKWPFSCLKRGYPGAVWLDGDQQVLACRFMCELVNGPAPTPDHQAAHSCGKGTDGCINPKHLLWKTAQENADDKIVHGTNTVGVRHPMAKLTEAKVRQIKRSSATCEVLGIRFSVSRSTISQIRSGKIWRHVA